MEGDALGSQIAFYCLLKAMHKQAAMVNDDDLPYGYNFLAYAGQIKKFNRDARKIKFDCLVLLDCSDLSRCGEVRTLNRQNKPVLNIDHHISNSNFGDVNWVQPHASSTSEMVYKLYKKLGVTLEKKAALALYVGIMTDTGSFHYSNTTSATHKIVSDLLKYKFDIPQIYKNIYENIPYRDMQLFCRILATMQRDASGRLVWFQIKGKNIKDKKPSFDLSEHVLGFGRAIKGVEVAVLFKESQGAKGEIRVNLRSQGKVDVNKIAQFFGGGGHKTASGATLRGDINAVSRRVLRKIRQSLR
jgi:phosphoesterase RecJ-like protein